MPQFGWTDKVIAKALAAQQGSISLVDAGIPLIEGSFVIPPVIHRDGVTYALSKKTGKPEPYKNVIRVKKENGDNYSYTPVDGQSDVPSVDDAISQTEAYDYSMKEESATYSRLLSMLKNAKTLLDGEEEILDIEFTAADKPINELLKSVIDHFRRPGTSVVATKFSELLDYLEGNGHKAAPELKELLKQGLSTRADFTKANKLLGTICGDKKTAGNEFTAPLVAFHIKALVEYKVASLATEKHQYEVDVHRNNVMLVNNLIESNFAIHNSGRRVEKDTTSFSKSLITAVVMSKAIANNMCADGKPKKKAFACFCKQQELDLKSVSGFSKEAGWAIHNFFKDLEPGKLEIKVDGESINYQKFTCGNTQKGFFKKIELTASSSNKSLTIDYGDSIADDSGKESKVADEFSSVLRKAESGKKLELSLLSIFHSNYLTSANVSQMLGSIHTKKDFVTIKSGKNTKRFNLTYSRDVVHNHRGELGQIFMALLHDGKDKSAAQGFTNQFNIFIEELVKHVDEIETIIRNVIKERGRNASTKGGSSGNARMEKSLASLLPLVTVIKNNPNASIAEINLAYLRYYGLLNGLVESAEDEALVKEFFEAKGYLPETTSRFLANMQSHSLNYYTVSEEYPQITNASISTRPDKDEFINNAENTIIEGLRQQLGKLKDNPHELRSKGEEFTTKLMQKTLDLVNTKGRGKKGLNVKRLTDEEKEEVIGGLVSILREKGAAWKDFYTKLTGLEFSEEDFFTSIVTDMLDGLTDGSYATKFYEKYITMLSLGNYLTGIMSDESTKFSVIHIADDKFGEFAKELDFSKMKDPIHFIKKILVDSAVDDHMKYKIVGSRKRKDQDETYIFNSKRSSGSSSGMVDYGIDVITLNHSITDGDQTGRTLKLRTDSFEYKCGTTATGYMIPHVNDAVTVANATVSNMLSLLSHMAEHLSFNRIVVERGTSISIGARRGDNNKLTFGYILRDAPDESLRQHIYGTSRFSRRMPLEVVEDTLDTPIPVVDTQMFFDGAALYNPISIHEHKIGGDNIKITKSFAEEYARRYARMLIEEGDEGNIAKSFATAMHHPMIGSDGFAAFVAEMRSSWKK